MDAEAWVVIGTIATGLGTAIKVVYTRLNTKLDQCEEKHEDCERNHVVVEKRLSYIEGHLAGQGAEIPQGE